MRFGVFGVGVFGVGVFGVGVDGVDGVLSCLFASLHCFLLFTVTPNHVLSAGLRRRSQIFIVYARDRAFTSKH